MNFVYAASEICHRVRSEWVELFQITLRGFFSICKRSAACSHLASCHCRHKASPLWGRSSRGQGCRSCFCNKGCHRLRLSSTCRIHSTLCWQLSSQVCTSRGRSSYWGKSWSWTNMIWISTLTQTEDDWGVLSVSGTKRLERHKNCLACH